VSGAPSVERELALSHLGYVAFAFAVPLVAAAAIEAGIALLSDVWGRARLVVLGEGVLAASLFFTASARTPEGLALGLALAGAASGVSCGAAQALLVASSAGGADRAMVRWSLYSAVGDVVAPVITGAAISLGHSYRGALEAVAAAASLQCAVSAWLLVGGQPVRQPATDSEGPGEPLGVALARAIRLPRLWAWLFAAASCTLLDELVIALAALRLERAENTGAAVATAAAVAFSVGAVVGSAVTDRIVERISAPRVLATSAALCALSLAAFLTTASASASCAALLVVGVTCAPHHPLAMARAYGELPENPGTVQAVGQIFVAVDVVAPLALGVVADRFGLDVAIGCLLVQPAVILIACLLLRPCRRGARP